MQPLLQHMAALEARFCYESALIFAGSPVSMLRVPAGKPARRASSAIANAVSGVDSAGFKITCPYAAPLRQASTAGMTAGPAS